MQRKHQKKRNIVRAIGVGLFVFGYPMLLSIYVHLPLFIGIWGYVLLLGLKGDRLLYIVGSFIYFVNLDLNVSLPFWLPIVAVVPVYRFVVPLLQVLRRCGKCVALITVACVDVTFFGVLRAYDFVFQTHTLSLDTVAFTSFIIDLIAAVVL